MDMNEDIIKTLKANKKVLSLLSLAQKAGYAASGEFLTEKTIKEGKAYLVILASDASDNTKKMFNNMCSFYKVPFFCYADKEGLGRSLGKEFRASVALTDKGMANAIIKQLNM